MLFGLTVQRMAVNARCSAARVWRHHPLPDTERPLFNSHGTVQNVWTVFK
jgi:hypothetical protein